jgi:hypothetical protein
MLRVRGNTRYLARGVRGPSVCARLDRRHARCLLLLARLILPSLMGVTMTLQQLTTLALDAGFVTAAVASSVLPVLWHSLVPGAVLPAGDTRGGTPAAGGRTQTPRPTCVCPCRAVLAARAVLARTPAPTPS